MYYSWHFEILDLFPNPINTKPYQPYFIVTLDFYPSFNPINLVNPFNPIYFIGALNI